MKWTIVRLLTLLFIPTALAAQGTTGGITGTVTSGTTPLAGVNVSVAGPPQRTTVTGADGRYTITGLAPGSYQVRASRIGYGNTSRAVTVSAGETSTANFTLTTEALALEGVVAVGYGTQERRNVAGSITTVTTDATENAPITSIDQILQGTAPGVQVTTASSEPGGALSIRIRGASSITGSSEPLYVIDGFPIENDIEGSAVGNGGRARTTPANPLVSLNPSDVESISILKDASSTAIYGARGANGVVIITTKQGRGNRPQFSLDVYSGSQTVAKRYDLLDAAGYMDYANTFAANASTPYVPFSDSARAAIVGAGIDTDWQDEVFQRGGMRNLQLSVRGATTSGSPTRYALSGGYFDQDGVVVGSGLRRYSGRLNLNQAIGSRVELGASFTANQARTKSTPTAGQQNAGAGAVSAALQYVPILPVRRPDGTYSYINTDLNAYNRLLDAPQTPNPVSLTTEVRDSLSDTRLLGNVFGEVELLEGLDLRVSMGADYADRTRLTYYPRTTLRGQTAPNGEAIRALARTTSWLNENTLTYQRDFGDAHDLTLLGGYTRQATSVDGESLSNSNFVSDITGYFDIGSGAQAGGPTVSSRRANQTLESWLGRVNYTLLDRYIATFTVRADASSRFAENHKWGTFPSGALAWRASEESFLRDVDALDDLKFRASYGVVGNPGIRPYQSLSRLNDQGYSFGGVAYSGYYSTAVGNPDLSWESTAQLDLGVDVAFLNRFTLTADWYRKRTTDLLLQVDLPVESGFESALDNRGVVDNQGFEFGLDARIVQPANRNGFSWRANVNYARNRNEVIDLGEGVERLSADLLTTDFNLPGTLIQVGQPLGVFFGYRSAGVIRDTAEANRITWTNFGGTPFREGDMMVLDISGPNGVPDGRITADDRTVIGDPTPDFTLGLTNTFGWRGVELTGLLQGSYGNEILNINRIRTESSPRVNVARERFENAWTPENRDAKYPRIGENPNQVGTNDFTDNLLDDGSYLRLRTLTLSYGIPTSFGRRYGLSGARVYATGTNIFTITDYSGYDPDVSSQSVGNTNRGIDIGAYPLSRSLTFGVNLTY